MCHIITIYYLEDPNQKAKMDQICSIEAPWEM